MIDTDTSLAASHSDLVSAYFCVLKRAEKAECELDEIKERCERYRLEANSFMLQRDEAVNECNEQARLLAMGAEREASLRTQLDEALRCIRNAQVAFCEDGSDGEIAAKMFKILTNEPVR
jgi:hypothetical protein